MAELNIMRTHTVSPELDQRLSALEHDLDEGLVPAWVFGNDAELYALERERLFPRVLSFIGHVSEIPSRGDHVTRYIGEDSFIFVRGQDDQVRLFFNACRHRGTQVCAVESGNSTLFQCPYHGWTYSNTGKLTTAPAHEDAISGLDRDEWGLLAVPRLESYHGLYFACLDRDAPSLAEYIGDAAYYLDVFFGLFDDLEVASPPQRYSWPTTWKAGFDGFGDDYHLITLHRSLLEVGALNIPPAANMLGHHVITGHGHNTTISIAPSDETAYWGYPSEIIEKYSVEHFDPLQVDLVKRSRVLVGTLFPNFSYLIVPMTVGPDRPATPFAQIRMWQPRGYDRMDAWTWNLVPASAPESFRLNSQVIGIQTFGSSGVFDQDDGVTGLAINRTSSSTLGRAMKLNYQCGYRIGSAKAVEDWPGPGLVTSHRYAENSYRYTFRQWVRFLREDGYPELIPAPSELD